MTTLDVPPGARASRPPLVRSVPILGPIRAFTGDVLPFLTECRATYGDAFRLRMANVEMTCLCGPDAIALLQKDSGLRTSTSMHVLDREMDSRLPSMIDGPNRQTIRKAHHQFMNHSLESTRRDEIQAWLDEHTRRWEPGVRLDVLSEAQTQTVDVLSRLLNGEPFPFSKRDLALVVHTMIWATFGHAPRMILRNPAYRSVQRRMRATCWSSSQRSARIRNGSRRRSWATTSTSRRHRRSASGPTATSCRCRTAPTSPGSTPWHRPSRYCCTAS